MRKRIAFAFLPIITFALVTPLTVSCQRGPKDPDAGIEELQRLARNGNEKPAVSDLTSIEARYPRSGNANRSSLGQREGTPQNYLA